MLSIALGPFLSSLFIAVVSTPIIIRVADLKHLMDEPDSDRKLHQQKTPTLGGVALFAGTLFSFTAFTDYYKLADIKFVVPALVLLFFTGIKDDILMLDPWKKLVMQFFCAVLISWFGGLQITSLWGMFGITEISFTPGLLLTLVLIVASINAFNLIDGVNGLAGSLGLISSLFFGLWFLSTGFHSLSILAFSLCGALVGFLIFNFRPARIFMGDTGSMLIGFVVSILAIKFIETNRLIVSESSSFYIKAAPGVAIAAIMVPFMDMTRIFICRLLKGKSPFKADRTHIHHILVDLGFSHTKTTFILVAFSILIIGLSLVMSDMRSLELVCILTALYMIFVLGLVLWKRRVTSYALDPRYSMLSSQIKENAN